jgi:hypothetical protein
MARWEQFEVWVLNGPRWTMVAAFNDFELASTVSRNRSERMRLIHTVYENGKVVEQDILAELGNVRTGS